MNKCQFRILYDDLESDNLVDFECDEDSVEDNFCVFHHKTYHERDPENVVKKLMDKIDKSITKKEPMYCIGYNLPSIHISKSFDKRVSFQSTTFHGYANFDHSEFHDVADFLRTTFEDTAHFEETKFQKVFFGLTEFQEAYFYGSTFKEVEFIQLEGKELVFSNTQIEKGEFRQITFQDAYFVGAVFHDVSFNYANFNSAFFGEAVFQGQVNFTMTKFTQADFSNTRFDLITSFNRVVFENPELTLFDRNLSKVSFIGSDITRIRFGENVFFGGDDRFTIIEELLLMKHPEKINLSSVLSIYGNLRENYEYRLRYEEAGKFFIREMELKRKYEISKPKKWFKRNLYPLGLYYWLCKYGESYVRPFLWSLLVIGVSTIYFFVQANPTFESLSNYENLVHAGNAFYKGATAFSQARIETQEDHIIRILSVPILGTLFIALRRKLERRFRH